MSTLVQYRRPVAESGMATVLVLGLLFLSLMLAAILGNVVILIGSKIKLHDTADASAISGASVQAAYLNRIQAVNNQIARDWQGLQQVTSSVVFPDRSVAIAFINSWRWSRFEVPLRAVHELSRTGASEAAEMAARVAHANLAEATFSNRSHPELHSQLADFSPAGVAHLRHRGNVVFSYYVYQSVVVETMPSVPSYLKGKPGPVTYFAVGVSGPLAVGEQLLAAVDLGFTMPRLDVFAAAKPYGGTIGRNTADRYRAWLVRIGALYERPPLIPEYERYQH